MNKRLIAILIFAGTLLHLHPTHAQESGQPDASDGPNKWGAVYATAWIPLQADLAVLNPFGGITFASQNGAFYWSAGLMTGLASDQESSSIILTAAPGYLFVKPTDTEGTFFGAGLHVLHEWVTVGSQSVSATAIGAFGVAGFRSEGFATEAKLMFLASGSQNTTVALELSVGFAF